MIVAAFVVSAGAVVVSVVAVYFARRSASAAEASAEEARKFRLQAGGPSVTLIRVEEDRRRWVLAPMLGHRDYIEKRDLNPIPEYVLPRDGNARLAVSCSVTLRNEGSTSTSIDIPDEAFVHAPADEASMGTDPVVQKPRPDGSYVLEPSQTCVVVVRQGLTIDQWVVHNGGAALSAMFSATNPSGTVTDKWSVNLIAHVLDPVHGDAARWIEVPMVPTKAEVSKPIRSYDD